MEEGIEKKEVKNPEIDNGGGVAAAIEGEGKVVKPVEATGDMTPEAICERYDIERKDGQDALSAIDNYINTEQEINRRLVDTLRSEPLFAQFVSDIVKGATFEQAVVKNCDVSALAAGLDDNAMPDENGLRSARDERVKRFKEWEEKNAAEEKERNDFQTELDTNKATFKEMFDAFCKEKGVDEAGRKELMKKLGELLSDVHRLKISREVLQMVYDSMRMDEIREEAREEGVIAGRNEKIETMRMKRAANDGLPPIGNSTKKDNGKEAEEETFFTPMLKKRNLL